MSLSIPRNASLRNVLDWLALDEIIWVVELLKNKSKKSIIFEELAIN